MLILPACGGNTANTAEDGTVYIGLVTDVGGINDKSFNQTAYEGLMELCREDPSYDIKYLESHLDADYQANVNIFIDEGADLIICCGYMFADTIREAALAHPEQKFAIIDDASNDDLPNVACLMFSQEQAGYLAGLAAGYMTKTKTVGYVQGMVSEVMNCFGTGYVTGVLSACPDARIIEYNSNSFTDIAGGAAAAKSMVTNGADVIFHAAGNTGVGVINTCGEENIWAIGVDTDQSSLDPAHVLTSAMKCVDVAARDISESVKEGTFTGGVHKYDLSNGGVGLAPTRDNLPEDILAKISAAEEKILEGAVDIPVKAEDCPAFTLK